MPSQSTVDPLARLRAAATALVVTVALVLAAAVPSQAQPAPGAGSEPGGGTDAPPALGVRTLTLVTGDRVTVVGAGPTPDAVHVSPRPGVHYLQEIRNGELHLVPTDALPLLAADRLDERLFNLTLQLAGGLDRRDELPLMLAEATTVAGIAADERTELPTIGGFAAAVPVTDLAAFWEENRDSLRAGKIWLDGVNQLALDVSVPLTGAPAGWAAGLDGSGIRVAVLDTGIDDTHPDLAGKVVDRANFIDTEPPVDINGHGTHVASTLAGTGAGSDGRYRGVATGVELLDAKVCGWYVGCPDSALLQAMQWAVDAGAQVINLSLGQPDRPGLDPIERAVNQHTADDGVLFVISAGNHSQWSGPQGVNSPSTAEAALSVANATKADRTGLVASSEFGPRPGDYGVKPEVAAPGENILAAFSSESTVEYDPARIVNLPGGDYLSLTGTSMAAPHVTGLAAMLLEQHPDWSPEQVKAALVGSAVPMPAVELFGQGAGHVDLARAMSQPVTASPSVLNLGRFDYPHTGAVDATVTYHNRGDEPLSVALSVDGDVPAGVLSLSAEEVIVPADGSVAVTVTVDPRAGGDAYGGFGARLVAAADGIAVQTPVSLFREEPSATLRIRGLDRTGAAPLYGSYTVVDLDTGELHFSNGPADPLRLPMGEYAMFALVSGAGGDRIVLLDRRFTLAGDREIVADGRKAKPIEVKAPHRDAVATQASVSLQMPHLERTISGEAGSLFTGDLGGGRTDGVRTEVRVALARPDGAGGFTDSPYGYQLAWLVEGTFPTGLKRTVKASELATVRAEYAGDAPGGTVIRFQGTVLDERTVMPTLELPPFGRPGVRTEYYHGGVEWTAPTVSVTTPGQFAWDTYGALNPPGYESGKRYTERWLGAVIGPSAQLSGLTNPIAFRRGDVMVTDPGVVRDGAGHLATRYYSDGQLQLYRDGELVAEGRYGPAELPMGSGPASYRMRHVLEFHYSRLSTRTESEWTFDSAPGQPLPPLTTVGFTPELRIDNTAAVRRTLPVPIELSRQGSAAEVTSLTVEVSFDDGATWAGVPLAGGGRIALVRHPTEPGFVSLRGSAIDADGNTVQTAIIRAYEIR